MEAAPAIERLGNERGPSWGSTGNITENGLEKGRKTGRFFFKKTCLFFVAYDKMTGKLI